MPDPKKLFTQEFRDEAVRLAQTSGRSRREVASDLGIGRSTLRNWIDRRRDRLMEQPPADRQEDMTAELKRLRRENEVLRQERDILKKAVVGSSDERNSFGQGSSWRLKAKGFSWPGIEPERDCIQVALAIGGQVRTLREILPQQ